jgi:hypothetical protein
VVERMQFLFFLPHKILTLREAKVEFDRLYRNSCTLHKIQINVKALFFILEHV